MYIVIEIQRNDGNISTLTYQFDTMALADQKFYTIMAAAAVSTIEAHSAIILDYCGNVIRSAGYDRTVN